jgi:hypothetical protein
MAPLAAKALFEHRQVKVMVKSTRLSRGPFRRCFKQTDVGTSSWRSSSSAVPPRWMSLTRNSSVVRAGKRVQRRRLPFSSTSTASTTLRRNSKPGGISRLDLDAKVHNAIGARHKTVTNSSLQN